MDFILIICDHTIMHMKFWSLFPGQYMSYFPLAFRMSLGFPVLSHRIASNRRIFIKFMYGHGVMMHVKIHKNVIGCREVFAL